MEELKEGKRELTGDLDVSEIQQGEWTWSGGIPLRIIVTPEAFQAFAKWTDGKHNEDGPDVLTISAPVGTAEVQVNGKAAAGKWGTFKNRSFKTAFAPGPVLGCLRCLIAGEPYKIDGIQCPPDEWKTLADGLTERNAVLGFVIPEGEPQPDNVLTPIRADFFKAPGRLFDTPRHITGQGKMELLPEIGRWFQQAAFNRTVGMAAAALTKMDTREAILDWQSATVEEVADLVFCRSEGGKPSYGQNKEDILKAFEALRAIPIPIVKIDWRKIGTGRNPRWIKEYKLRVASLLQSYGPVFVDKLTGKEVFVADPARKKDLVKAKPDRRISTRKLVEMNPVDGILKAFPADKYTLTRFEWRWNTDIAEDFICPQVALDTKDRPRLKQVKGRHIEGSRFIMLNKQYFAVQKHLRVAGSTYGPRLLDMIVSEKSHIKERGKGAVLIEIEAEKIVKWLDLWPEYQRHPKRVLEERIAPAIMALIHEKVLLLESWMVPQKDKNEDRRKNPYYKWKVAELWTTVALVPPEEAKDIEDELVAHAEDEEAARSFPSSSPDQVAFPGIIDADPSVPSGSDIGNAIKAAGGNLRRFAEMINDGIIEGGSFNTWARYIRGERIKVNKISPEAWQRVRNFIAGSGKKDA